MHCRGKRGRSACLDMSVACEIIPWQEIDRMIHEKEKFPPALAAKLWQSARSDDPLGSDGIRSPFPFVDYSTGQNYMPDGKTIVEEHVANAFARRLMKTLRAAVGAVGESPLARCPCKLQSLKEKREKKNRAKKSALKLRDAAKRLQWSKPPPGLLPGMYSEC